MKILSQNGQLLGDKEEFRCVSGVSGSIGGQNQGKRFTRCCIVAGLTFFGATFRDLKNARLFFSLSTEQLFFSHKWMQDLNQTQSLFFTHKHTNFTWTCCFQFNLLVEEKYFGYFAINFACEKSLIATLETDLNFATNFPIWITHTSQSSEGHLSSLVDSPGFSGFSNHFVA